jgi:hypothetical protein
MVVHILPENLSSFIALYVAFTFLFNTIVPYCQQGFFWKRNLKPLMKRGSFPFSQRITLATFTGSIFTPTAWHTAVTAEN